MLDTLLSNGNFNLIKYIDLNLTSYLSVLLFCERRSGGIYIRVIYNEILYKLSLIFY